MDNFSNKLNKMKSTISKMKSEITTIQKKNEDSISHIPKKQIQCSSMQNLFKPPQMPNETDNSQQVNVSQINANNYTNYFIIPKTEKCTITKTAREKLLMAEKKKLDHIITAIKSEAEIPIKINNTNDIEKLLEVGTSHRQSSKGQYNPKTIEPNQIQNVIGNNDQMNKHRNNMFLNFTQDAVQKKTQGTRVKYNSFDCRGKEHCYNNNNSSSHNNEKEEEKKEEVYQRFLDDMCKIFNSEVSIRKIPERLRISIDKASQIDNMIKDLNGIYQQSHPKEKADLNKLGRWVKNATIRHELYAQEIELYRALCEDLIRQTDIQELDDISQYANAIKDTFAESKYGDNDNNNNHNNTFIRSVNAMIRNRYIVSERPTNIHDYMPSKKMKKGIKY